MDKCELCGKDHDGSYGSGRFCCKFCAKKFSTKNQVIRTKKCSCIECGDFYEVDFRRDPAKFKCEPCKETIKKNKNTERKVLQKKENIKKYCLNCGKEVSNKYCSAQCQNDYQSKIVVDKWLKTGKLNSVIHKVNFAIRQHIMNEQNSKCAICGMERFWNGKPLNFILDHINGISTQNNRENLRFICHNCDSQLDTYKSKNKGKGRGSLAKLEKES